MIDFQLMDIFQAKAYRLPFAHLEKAVLPYVNEKARIECETRTANGVDPAGPSLAQSGGGSSFVPPRRNSPMRARSARCLGTLCAPV